MSKTTQKYGFVYIWYDRKHKRYYIGAHWGALDDGYICSSSWMNTSYKKRPEDFKRRIIKTGFITKREMFDEESRYLAMVKETEIKPLNPAPRYYNLHTRHREMWYSDPIRLKSIGEKISAKKKGKSIAFADPEARIAKIKATKAAKPYSHSEELRQQMSESRKGRKGPESQKLAIAKTYVVTSPEGIQETVVNLAAFCAAKSLDKANITKKYGSKGWKAINRSQ